MGSVVQTIGAIAAINGTIWNATNGTNFQVFDTAASQIFGNSPQLEVLLNLTNNKTAHEAPVYIAANNTVWYASNRYGSGLDQYVEINYIDLSTNQNTVIPNNSILLANGATNYNRGIVWCAQGNSYETFAGGLWQFDTNTQAAAPLVNNFQGKPFNAPNDVNIHKPSSKFFFTDPPYSYAFGYKPPPVLPSQVYAFDPSNGNIQVVADDLIRPNGINFSPDYHTMYVSDTGQLPGGMFPVDLTNPATIYAYNLSSNGLASNRRVLAYVGNGIPDGVKVDVNGRLYVSCGDGVHIIEGVDSPKAGKLLGKIITGLSSNLVFAGPDLKSLVIMNEERIVRVNLTVAGVKRPTAP